MCTFLPNTLCKYVIIFSKKSFIFKGKGASGRFTVPGLKPKKRKKKKIVSEDEGEDQGEYEVKKTKRDEDREAAEAEREEQRQARLAEAVRKELEKASRPKKPSAPKKTEWEVEMVTKMKVFFFCFD